MENKQEIPKQQRSDDMELPIMSISADLVVRKDKVYPVINVNGHKDIVILLLVELYKFVQDKTGNRQKFHDDFDGMVTSDTKFEQVAMKKARLAMKQVMAELAKSMEAKKG